MLYQIGLILILIVLALLIAKKKEAFKAEGGNVIDFNFTSPLKKRFNLLSKDFREKQQTFQKNRTQELNQNLEIRLQIIEDIKGLINVEGDIHSTYKTFKNLQEHWRNTGQIPASENNNTWNNYRHHVEIFYGFLHLNRDLRDLDYKHNLEQKQKIIHEPVNTETSIEGEKFEGFDEASEVLISSNNDTSIDSANSKLKETESFFQNFCD